jgi:hypothetical protein
MQLAALSVQGYDGGSAMSACFKVFSMLFAGMIVPSMVAAAETPSAADVQRHHLAINNALTTAAPFKQEVESYRRHHDAFPVSNVEATLGPPESYMNPDVRQVAIDRDGIINITLTASSGVDGGVIRLTPNMPKNSDDLKIEWKCTSANYSDISDATLGVCEYTKVP